MIRQKFSAALSALGMTMISRSVLADGWSMNMTRGVTPVSREIYSLHMTIFAICFVIAVIVFGVMIYTLIFHRKSRGYKAAEFHEHPALEVLWAVVPFIILVIMAIPATRVLIAMESPGDSDITIKVTGYQWKWKYDYLDEGISFFSNLSTPLDQVLDQGLTKNRWYLYEVDKELVVPIRKKIRFLVTANDVIHSWWVPDLGIKRDAIPGFIHEAWARIDKPGVYRGQCAELCGVNHGYMPIVVRAVTDLEYAAWVKTQRPESALPTAQKTAAVEKTFTKTEAMQLGKETYNKICAVCHKPDGTGQPPLFPPLKGSSIAVGKPIATHILRVLNGVQGTAMQAFASQLTDEEIASVVTYERNAFGNNTGDTIQPKDVRVLRGSH